MAAETSRKGDAQHLSDGSERWFTCGLSEPPKDLCLRKLGPPHVDISGGTCKRCGLAGGNRDISRSTVQGRNFLLDPV